MEKKDYLSLQSKYALVTDCQERYRKELLDFINKAFEMHGNEFEYKCDTHATWQEKNEDEEDEFDAMNDLPVCVTIWVDDDGGHEVYPTCIRQYGESLGYKCIEADGWDWYDSSWVKYQQIHSSIEELQSVVDFINAVLEQEQEGFHSLKESNMEQQVREMYDKYMEEHGHKPQYLKCVVRWKDDGDEGLDNIALDQSADDEDCVSSVSGILALQDLIRYNEEDFEIVELVEMWGKEE